MFDTDDNLIVETSRIPGIAGATFARLAAITAASLLTLTGCGGAGDGSGGPTSNSDPGGGDDEIDEVRSAEQRISNPGASEADVHQLTDDNADFAFDLYDELASRRSGENFFYSPHSISTALAMTYTGAEGGSETQMKKTLRFELPESDLHPTFNRLDLTLERRARQSGNAKKGSPFELNVANSIWGQKNFTFENPFLDTLARHYGAGLRTVNFREKPDVARKAINGWVERETDNRIQDLLPRGSVRTSTRLVLTNAIYFEASWAQKFPERKTSSGAFETAAGQRVNVDMMAQRTQRGLSYAETDDFKAVELPYVGQKVSMVVLVPDEGSFASVEDNLSGAWIQSKVFAELSESPVDLKMPTFEFESKFSVNEILEALGMTDPFAPGAADFTDISTTARLFIQDVVHQSFVAVDEKGTEAAAATAVTAGTTSTPDFETVRVDRPFIFMIRDRETDAVVFAGRVLDPS